MVLIVQIVPGSSALYRHLTVVGGLCAAAPEYVLIAGLSNTLAQVAGSRFNFNHGDPVNCFNTGGGCTGN
jgi:hypothetical protein